MEFKEKVVLVTGGSAGIGEATALAFAARGARVAVVGRDEARLYDVAKRCGEALPIVADLSTDEGCERTAKEVLEHFKRIDVLVNNVGVGARTGIVGAEMAEFDCVFNTGLRGVYNLTRLLIPHLISTKGNVVNISSVAASAVFTGCLPYSMAKAALSHFTCLLALELAPKGVRVNTISPGLTVTTFQRRLFDYSDAEHEAWLRSSAKGIPLGRQCKSEEIADAVIYVASPARAMITGVDLPVDGGIRFVLGSNSDIIEQPIKK